MLDRHSNVADILTAAMCWQVADTLGKRSTVVNILTEAVRAYQAADVMETQGEVYLKNLNSLSDTLHDLKNRHEGTPCSLHRRSCSTLRHVMLHMVLHSAWLCMISAMI